MHRKACGEVAGGRLDEDRTDVAVIVRQTLLHPPPYAFTNRRMSTFSINPTAMKNIIVDEPPYEISGRGMPVVGRTPICIDTLISTWKTKNEMRQIARNVPPRSRACLAKVRACTIRNR